MPQAAGAGLLAFLGISGPESHPRPRLEILLLPAAHTSPVSPLTLPVEIDAGRRGLKLLREAGLTRSDDDGRGARAVLTAAGLTYLAAAVSAVLTLLYYIMLAQRN